MHFAHKLTRDTHTHTYKTSLSQSSLRKWASHNELTASLRFGKYTAQLIQNNQYSLDAVMTLLHVNLLQLHMLACSKHMCGTEKNALMWPRRCRDCVLVGCPGKIASSRILDRAMPWQYHTSTALLKVVVAKHA